MSKNCRNVWIAGAALAVAAITACATGTPYATVAANMPALAAGQGRIMIYMTDSSQPMDFYPTVTVDSVAVGTIHAGTFFYVDRPAGLHQIGIDQQQASIISDQIATEPVTVDVVPGATAYVHAEAIEIIARVQVVLRPEIPENATRDLQDLSLVAQEPPE